MTTKQRRGRDPEQHVVHAGIADANRFKGMHGELTFVAAATEDNPRAIVQARLHNGLDNGGFVLQTIPATSPSSVLPPAVVFPATEIELPAEDEGEGSVVIEHGLGYLPLIQLVSSAGDILLAVPSTITARHLDANRVQISNSAEVDVTLTVILR